MQNNILKKIDWNLTLLIIMLLIIGLVNLYSASHSSAGINKIFFLQLGWIGVGLLAYFILTFIDYNFIKRFSVWIFGINLIALGLVPIIGKTFYGAKRWLDLGFFRYQPSETMKLALILLLANILSKNTEISKGLSSKKLLLPIILTLIPFGLTVKQPDLGTALLYGGICASLLLFMKVQKKILLLAAISGLIAVPVAWEFGLKEYQKNRVLTFLSPGRDPRGAGYNSIQSKIAIGSGQFLGKGYQQGTQSQLEFLPERHTDFVFSVLSEERGFLGAMIVLALFLMLFSTTIRIASEAKDLFGSLLIIGCTSFIFLHVFINIGMVIGILPIVGIPLPLLSYGGSSLVATMVALGLISSVSFRKDLFN